MEPLRAPPPPGTGRRTAADPRDIFVTFAFAAADLLVETDPQGIVTFAAGAFRHHLGQTPEAFLGRPLESLIAAEERNALGMSMQILATRGRLPPTATRLNGPRRPSFCLAGLAPAGPGGRFCLTLGPLPVPPQAAAMASRTVFTRAAAGAAGHGTLALIDLPQEVRKAIGSRPDVEGALDAALLAEGGGGLAGRLARGRYGLVLGGESGSLEALVARIEDVLGSHGLPGDVAARSLSLDTAGLTPAQATRALRHALSRFAGHGMAGVPEGGLAESLRQIAARAGEVRRAIAERRFNLLYQPIVDLRQRATHHYEALLRPREGGVEDFVRCAETVGLTEELDLAVADTVLDALRFSPRASIALNVSGLSMQSPRFREALKARLDARASIVPRLMVELTESVEVEDEVAARATIDMLRERGIALCIDDFGAGAAAFRYLRNFAVDWVKVDGAYVKAALRSEKDRSFVASMVDLSLAVGARVIAEQVETEEHAAVMASLGVEMAQGYLFARPAPLPAG
ncbi:sensor domain-containing phosphodiesterase [Pararoseomonas indoligenes]|uniref:EAL domain-containing protein n=1 Tax=Roseomonas indoligenes TaxID=2820811 RepID=A0A940MWZ6_9PROT|nr:EAL domain-containing protein [Pararoseomonas indoligenes]MBP0493223.1 EAL domain-containing protein [Pararoseomonas indoligenes]